MAARKKRSTPAPPAAATELVPPAALTKTVEATLEPPESPEQLALRRGEEQLRREHVEYVRQAKLEAAGRAERQASTSVVVAAPNPLAPLSPDDEPIRKPRTFFSQNYPSPYALSADHITTIWGLLERLGPVRAEATMSDTHTYTFSKLERLLKHDNAPQKRITELKLIASPPPENRYVSAPESYVKFETTPARLRYDGENHVSIDINAPDRASDVMPFVERLEETLHVVTHPRYLSFAKRGPAHNTILWLVSWLYTSTYLYVDWFFIPKVSIRLQFLMILLMAAGNFTLSQTAPNWILDRYQPRYFPATLILIGKDAKAAELAEGEAIYVRRTFWGVALIPIIVTLATAGIKLLYQLVTR